MPPVILPPARRQLPTGLHIDGHAIVSTDGMIAAADGSMPPRLRNDADWRQFQAALDRSAIVVLGRLGHERHRNPGRRRLVFTSGVADLAADPDDPRATLFNPAGMELPEALHRLGLDAGVIAVTGGGRVFDYFLPLYDRFVLVEVQQLTLPEGRPCFSAAHPRVALAGAGLLPRQFAVIDASAAVTSTVWSI